MIAEFVKGKVDESITKLVQPAGLVPAALFLLLNVAFVLPALEADQVPIATTIADMDGTWQAVAFGAMTLGLGYLLLTASGSILDLLSGEAWRGAELNTWLQRRERAKLTDTSRPWPAIPDGRVTLEELDAVWSLRSRYPLEGWAGSRPEEPQVRDVGPTRLGNTLRAGHRLLEDRYGIDAVALWSEMEAVIPADSASKTTLTDVRASLDTLVNLAFVLGLFAVEGLVLQSARGDWTAALGCALAAPVAYLVYRTAVPKARAWGDAMVVACDLFRDELHKKLELRETTTPADERDLWHKTSRVFLWGRDAVTDPDDIYKPVTPKASSKAEVTTSRGLEMTAHDDDEVTVPAEGQPPGTTAGSYVQFALLCAHLPSVTGDGLVTIADERLTRIPGGVVPDVVPAGAATASATTMGRMGAPDVLIVHLAGMAPDRAVWLRVVLPVWEFRVSDGLVVTAASAEAGDFTYDLTISASPDSSPPANDRMLEVFMAGTPLAPRLLKLESDALPIPQPPSGGSNGRSTFDLSELELPARVRISFPAAWNEA